MKRLRPLLLAIGLLGIVAGATFHRFLRYAALPSFDAPDGVTVFDSESTFQLRYAVLAAGEGIPARDKDAQFPVVLEPRRELATLMERVYGACYRAAGGARRMPAHVFAAWFGSFFSALGSMAVFAACLALGLRPIVALYGAALYAFTGAAFDRVMAFEHEYFALPWFGFTLAALLAVLRVPSTASRPSSSSSSSSYSMALLAALASAVALDAWHLSRTLLGVLALALLAALVRGPLADPARVARALPIWLAGVYAALLAIPFQRAAGGVLSVSAIPFHLLLAWCLSAALGGRRGRMWTLVGACGLIVASVVGSPDTYSHMADMAWAKLRFPWGKPADPAALSMGARIMWYEGFANLEPGYALYAFGMLLPASVFGLARLLRPRPHLPSDPARRTLFALCAGLSLLALLLNRLGAALALPLAPAAVCAASATVPTAGRWGRRWAVAAWCGALWIHVAAGWNYEESWVRKLIPAAWDRARERTNAVYFNTDQRALVTWAADHLPPRAAIVANIEIAPWFLWHAGRRTVLHPKFEIPYMRARFAEYVRLLYGNEPAALPRWMDEHGATHLVLPAGNVLDTGPYSYRYIAGVSAVDERGLAYRLHFHPESIPGLRLVFRNGMAQVFERTPDGESRAACRPARLPMYDASLLTVAGTDGVRRVEPARVARAAANVRAAWDGLGRVDALARSGDWQAAAGGVRRILRETLPDFDVLCSLAAVLDRGGLKPDAFALAQAAADQAPDSVRAWNCLAEYGEKAGRPDEALRAARESIRLDPVRPEPYFLAARLLLDRGDVDGARRYLGQVRVLYPGHPGAEELLDRATRPGAAAGSATGSSVHSR